MAWASLDLGLDVASIGLMMIVHGNVNPYLLDQPLPE